MQVMRMNKNADDHNVTGISIYRVIFAIFVALHHIMNDMAGQYFKGAYMPVSFFYILSGFLLVRSLDFKDLHNVSPEQAAYRTLWSRIKSFYFDYFVSLCFAVGVSVFVLKIFPLNLESVVDEVFLLHGIIPLGRAYNFATWYLSCMLFAIFILSFLFLSNKERYLKVFCPVIVLLCYGGLYRYSGHLNVNGSEIVSPLTNGTTQAIAGMALGSFLYFIDKSVPYKLPNALATILELACFAGSCMYMIFGQQSKYDFIILLLLALLIFSTFHNDSFIKYIIGNKTSKSLSKLSLLIYIYHASVQYVFVCAVPIQSLALRTVLFLLTTIVFSVCMNQLIMRLCKLFKA